MNVIYLWGGIICKKKTSVYILKPFWEIGQSFEESLRGGELIKNLEIFWRNNKTIIEFGFRMTRRKFLCTVLGDCYTVYIVYI